ncbi:uncharacterized protein SCHCODRAFT_02516144 [Schizophyllum commune H4-8]|uniref:uncharacterized protein n=1 Tax=Schizophyllum commune (strain H4-8 / FGSC 9210) TaxID=578458 RepID=UPI00215FECC1|nr:uncharacterized protein SCHCODRAFT_02513063 [Schizophyllum commune H4-8]XP_050198039.1 uncharacterized protein SCHCODRAFT_02516144 [Schizophyllum commune H4-8]KAI5887354.1 hypothetical protein SCHCODRAFT_02516144 [Schizophyllum commune H4-8]KAI5888897.1 hypothetical protein SCHCODRAFT_02513063 [Schizophyllum commune H4-8]
MVIASTIHGNRLDAAVGAAQHMRSADAVGRPPRPFPHDVPAPWLRGTVFQAPPSLLSSTKHSACSAARISGVWGFRGAWTIDGSEISCLAVVAGHAQGAMRRGSQAGASLPSSPSRLPQSSVYSGSPSGSIDASGISQKPRRHAGDAPRLCWRDLASVSHGWPTALEKIRRPTASMAACRANDAPDRDQRSSSALDSPPALSAISSPARQLAPRPCASETASGFSRVLGLGATSSLRWCATKLILGLPYNTFTPCSVISICYSTVGWLRRLMSPSSSPAAEAASALTLTTLPIGSDLCNPKDTTTSIFDFVNDEPFAATLVTVRMFNSGRGRLPTTVD